MRSMLRFFKLLFSPPEWFGGTTSDQLMIDLLAAREENEKLMNVDYWPERAKNAEKKVTSLKALISRVLTEKVPKQELEDALK